MQTVSPETHGDGVPGEPRIARFTPLSTLFCGSGDLRLLLRPAWR
jgi:hypothetical protein